MQTSIADLLPAYTDTKLKVGSIAEILLNIVRERKDDERTHAIQRLLADLAEDAFRFVLLGKYNRGKSSLMNAMLGHDWLPTGILPLTSVITTVRYGARERVLIRTEGSSLTHEIALAELAQYVTEESNPGNQKRVELAEVHLPSDLLRYGFLFIDTPGLGSGIFANTDATRRFLPEVDAAIVLLSFESPLDQEDIDLLLALHGLGRKVFIVMNKVDLVSEPMRERVACFVREKLREQLGGYPIVFAVSAREALRARMAGDEKGLIQSGLMNFEHAVTDFLQNEKAKLFLQRVMQRTREFLEQETLELFLAEQIQVDHGKESAVHELKARTQDLLERTRDAFARLRQQLPGLFASLIEDDLRAFLEEQKRNILAEAEMAKQHKFASVSEWIRPHAEAAAQKLREAEERELREITNAFSDLRERGNGVLGRSTADSSRESFDSLLLAVEEDVQIPTLPAFEWTIPGWAASMPSAWLRPKAIARLEKDFAIAVETYCANIIASLEQACLRWTERAQTDAEQKIQNYIQRFSNLDKRRDTTETKAILLRLQEELDKVDREYKELDQVLAPSLTEPNNNGSKQPCIVCRKVSDATRHHLMRIQYELTKDPAVQHELGESSGFCPFHTWMYESIGSPQGIAQGYSIVLDRVALRLHELASEQSLSRMSAELIALVPDSGKCRLCRITNAAESLALQELLENRRPPEHHENLCLPHLSAFVMRTEDAGAAKDWVKREADVVRRLAQDMRQFALKHNALRRYLTTENERDAYVYGLMQLVGGRQLSFVRKVKELL